MMRIRRYRSRCTPARCSRLGAAGKQEAGEAGAEAEGAAEEVEEAAGEEPTCSLTPHHQVHRPEST